MTVINPHGTKFCPQCGAQSTVRDSRIEGNGAVRRRRECMTCQHRYSTREYHADDPMLSDHRKIQELYKDLKAAKIMIDGVMKMIEIGISRVSHTDASENIVGSDLAGPKVPPPT